MRDEPNTSPSNAPPTGLLLIDKPAKRAVSSVTACRKVKRALRAAGFDVSKMRVGHAGTLDPLASGLLIVLVGRGATRLCAQLMDGPKTYEATIDLLRSSPSDDLETEAVINPLTRRPRVEEIEKALEGFRGVIEQRPPAYSAIWVDGVRAFKLARKAARRDSREEGERREGARGGTDVRESGAERDADAEGEEIVEYVEAGSPSSMPVLEARPVTIHEIEMLSYDWPEVTVRVNCSKGTYIRSLARDLGVAITGHPAVLTALRRTAVGKYDVKDAVKLEELPERITQAELIAV